MEVKEGMELNNITLKDYFVVMGRTEINKLPWFLTRYV